MIRLLVVLFLISCSPIKYQNAPDAGTPDAGVNIVNVTASIICNIAPNEYQLEGFVILQLPTDSLNSIPVQLSNSCLQHGNSVILQIVTP
jgi:hypothetical protein